MEHIIFRRIGLDDIPVFLKLRLLKFEEEGATVPEGFADALVKYLEEAIPSEQFISWVACDEDKIISTSGISFDQVLPHYSNLSGKIGLLSCMYTLKEYRRQGIAKELLGLVVEEAELRGCGFVNIAASDIGKLLYKDFGFVERGNYLMYEVGKKE